jgi:hypothetical protein
MILNKRFKKSGLQNHPLICFSAPTHHNGKMSESGNQLPKTRGGVLKEVLKAQLLLDIVANPNLSCDEIVKLPDREYKYNNIVAIRNRFHFLGTLKVKNPQQFWTLFSAANKSALSGPYRDTREEESDDEEPPSNPPARSRQSIISTPPRSSSNSSKKSMSGSRAKVTSSPAATSAFAYDTMFESLKEAEDSGMLPSINLVLVHLLFSLF